MHVEFHEEVHYRGQELAVLTISTARGADRKAALEAAIARLRAELAAVGGAS